MATVQKTCRSCAISLAATEFYAHPTTGDRLQQSCKQCMKARVYATRDAIKIGAYRKRPASRLSRETRKRANDALKNALRAGRIVPLPCWVCGEKAEAHHPDYSAPLDVVLAVRSTSSAGAWDYEKD